MNDLLDLLDNSRAFFSTLGLGLFFRQVHVDLDSHPALCAGFSPIHPSHSCFGYIINTKQIQNELVLLPPSSPFLQHTTTEPTMAGIMSTSAFVPASPPSQRASFLVADPSAKASLFLDDLKKDGMESETEDEEVKMNCAGGYRGIEDSDMNTTDDDDSVLEDDDEEEEDDTSPEKQVDHDWD